MIIDYMKSKGFDSKTPSGFFELWGEFHSKALKIWDEELAAEGGKPQKVILWSSELTKPNRIEKYLDRERFVSVIIKMCISIFLTWFQSLV